MLDWSLKSGALFKILREKRGKEQVTERERDILRREGKLRKEDIEGRELC